jgi:hypothetical protein
MVEVELDEKDYKAILTWFELAFAGKEKTKTEDLSTMNKIAVMCKAHVRFLEETKE